MMVRGLEGNVKHQKWLLSFLIKLSQFLLLICVFDIDYCVTLINVVYYLQLYFDILMWFQLNIENGAEIVAAKLQTGGGSSTL